MSESTKKAKLQEDGQRAFHAHFSNNRKAQTRQMQKPFPGPGNTVADEPRLYSQLEFIRQLLKAGGWYTLTQLCEHYEEATDKPMLQTSASAHVRSLRKPRHGGYQIERRLSEGKAGLYEYRMVADPSPIRIERAPKA